MIIKRLVLTLFLALSVLYGAVAQPGSGTELALAKEYVRKQEWAKAAATFQGLPAEVQQGPAAYPDYLKTLLSLKLYKDAEKLVKKTHKRNPDLTGAGVDAGTVLAAAGDAAGARKLWERVVNDLETPRVVAAATALRVAGQPELAERAWLHGRQLAKNESAYSQQLLELYAQTGQIQKTVEEVLRVVNREPTRVAEAQNLLQNVLHDEKDFEALERTLLTDVRENPDRAATSELLIWVYTQRKDFFAALVQAKALDQRERREGARVLDLAQIAFENHDFQSAIDGYDYIRAQYPGGQYYAFARQRAINAREAQIKSSFPVDPVKIRTLLAEYEDLLKELGRTTATAAVLRDEAMLYAFQLDEKDRAMGLLREVIGMPRVRPDLAAEAKLSLADIYLLKGEPWESTLLYSQVEKEMKETPVGYEAKLRNGRLSYFKGDFELAQAHLDILKNATTREIANDAMALSLLITDNTGLDLDSTHQALRRYASVELLVFQNKFSLAITRLDSLMRQFPAHPLQDEALYLKANLQARMTDYSGALATLQQIVQNPKVDILSDDALFLIAKLEEENLKQPAAAMQHYNEVLTKYPGSIFTAEARRRFRHLRGDSVN
jgi:TolA-binding protein/lipopolysaccharide biosynthesis regulator YciM